MGATGLVKPRIPSKYRLLSPRAVELQRPFTPARRMRVRGFLEVATTALWFLVNLRVVFSFGQQFKVTSTSTMSTPIVLPAKAPLPEIADGITVVSFNVLLPNGNDGWWMYKVG